MIAQVNTPRNRLVIYAVAAVLLIAWLGPMLAQRPGNQIAQSTIRGVLLGGIYAIVALGIVLINKASGVFNFAHGGLMMIISFIFFSFFSTAEITVGVAVLLATATVILLITMNDWKDLRQPRNIGIGILAVAILTVLMTVGGIEQRWLHAFVGAICGAILLGFMIERFTIRRLIGQPVFTAVMVTLAIGEFLDGLTKLIWGAQPRSLVVFGEPHPFLPGQLVRLQNPIVIEAPALGGDILIDQPKLFAFIASIIAFIVFWLFFRYTSIGLSMRAISENQQLAEAVGLRLRAILAITWAIAAVLAGIAGILTIGASDSSSLDANLQFVALRVFPAVLLGGLESIGGALVGGLIIGLSEEWAKLLFSGNVAEQLTPYVVLMVILVFRPEGLFGEKRIERI